MQIDIFNFFGCRLMIILLPALLLSCQSQQGDKKEGAKDTISVTSLEKGELLYAAHCAGCHGGQMQGTVAPALVNSALQHGGVRDSILKSISNGIPFTEMIKWSTVLSDTDIAAVTDFVVAARKDPTLVKKGVLPLTVKTKDYTLKIEKLFTDSIVGPWGIEFVDSNRALITGKMGELRWIVDGKLDPQKIAGLPKTYAYDMVGGMMDLALDPDYANNGWVYIGYSYNPKGITDKTAPGMTKVVRGKVKDHRWVKEETLFQVPDSLLVVGGTRWGCRLLFDKKGFLYFSIGDMNKADDSQLLYKPTGKVYRIRPDGSIPTDNPLVGKKNSIPAIYSWGNRNVQGLAQHPVTGVIYATEHGPQGGDELNILKNGANYGWPVITYGIDYDGSIVSNDTAKTGMEQPITYWTPSIAVSAITFVTGDKFPEWKNNLLVAALKFEEIRRLVINGNNVKQQEIILKGYGRVRDVKIGPDGFLYVLTNGPDALLRIRLQ